MDWANPVAALIPGMEGVVLQQLHRVNKPQTAPEVHRRAGAGSRTGIRYALERLAAQGVVTATIIGNVVQYELNSHHVAYPAVTAALKTYDPYGLLRARLAELLEEHFPDPREDKRPSLAIYGSVARREATTRSDVDLLLVLPDRVLPSAAEVEQLVADLHHHVPAWTGNYAHVHLTSRTDLVSASRADDPIVRSWLEDADTVIGTDVRHLMKEEA